MLEMEIRCSRSGTSGPTRATSLSPRLSARSPFPPNPQFPRNHCLWILHPILIHPHCWDTQDLPHLHHLTRKTLHQLLLLPDLPLIRLYGDSSTLGNPTLLTKYSQERNAGPVENLWTTLFFLYIWEEKLHNILKLIFREYFLNI